MMQDLILSCQLCPGDTVGMTAVVRDLHGAHPGRFRTDVRTAAPELWGHNPFITPIQDDRLGVRKVDVWPDMGTHHFIHGFAVHLEKKLGLRIPITKFHGDVYLAPEEQDWKTLSSELGIDWNCGFWIMMAGGKWDIRTKWWPYERYQAVVDSFASRIKFFQCGARDQWHRNMSGAVDLVGKTTIRQFVRLMHHASGVVCPITFAMHLAAAVPTREGRSPNRPCVVIAGGRESFQFIAYPHHRILATSGALPCCNDGGCWKSKCGTVRHDENPDEFCVQPVQVNAMHQLPKCMTMIEVDDVCRAVDQYHRGGVCRYLS